jgi:hypothetical protein
VQLYIYIYSIDYWTQQGFISVINQLHAQNFCFTISLFHASTCFAHMCSKHVETWNKLIVKQKFLCIKLVNYRDKYTDMHGQQNVAAGMSHLEITLAVN